VPAVFTVRADIHLVVRFVLLFQKERGLGTAIQSRLDRKLAADFGNRLPHNMEF